MARLLGIDAGTTVVRVAVLRTSYRKITLEALGEADVASSGSELEAVRAAVGALKADATAVALSGEKTFYRRLELPASAQKEIASVLPFELEANVPFEMNDAVYDYRVLKRAPGAEMLSIFTAVARADDVRGRITLVREATGHDPERVGTGPLPLTNLALLMPELEQPFAGAAPGPIAILDLGETTSDVVIVVGGEAVFARTLSRGTIGLPGTADALSRELRQTLASFRAIGGDPLAGMYLVGGGASAQGAESFLSTSLGVSILPLPVPKLDGVTPEQRAILPRFAKALGLAAGLTGRARGFDLRRGSLEAERRYPFLREKIPLLAGLGAVIAVSFGFSIMAEMRTLDAEHDALLAELGVTSRDILGEETTDPDHAKDLLEQGPGASDDDPMPHVDAFDVMVALSKAVPKDVVHDLVELDVNRGHVVIQATVPTNKDAEGIADKMKENKCFKDVKIPRTNQYGAETKQKYVIEFDLKCEDKKPHKAAEPAGSASAAPSGPKADEAKDGGR